MAPQRSHLGNNDVTDWSTSGAVPNPITGKGSVTLGGTPPYASNNGAQVSFRHPYFKKGDFLSFDAHVETLTPRDDVYSTRSVGMPA